MFLLFVPIIVFIFLLLITADINHHAGPCATMATYGDDHHRDYCDHYDYNNNPMTMTAMPVMTMPI